MWLIVGANGQLGRCLQDVLIEKNIDFIAASHSDLDVANQDNVSSFIDKHSLTNIVNCAAWTGVDDAEDNESRALLVNYEGPKNLANAALKADARLIHISTDYVFQGDAQTPYKTTTSTSPLNAYGRTKLKGDEAVLQIGSGNFPVIRTAWLYSRYGRNFAKTMVTRAIQGLPVRVVNDQYGQPTMAKDLAHFITEVASRKDVPQILHGTNSGQATWFEFAKEIYSQLAVDTSLVTPVSSSEFPTKAKRPSFSVLDHSELGGTSLSELRDWRKALAEEISEINNSVVREL
jgi:dTDP-4-dehydrorhamnose reductase